MKRVSIFIRQEAVRRTIHYYLVFIYLGLSLGVYGPTLPELAGQTASHLGQMGYIFLIGSIGFVLGNLLGGRLFDSVKSHLVIGAGQLISAALILLVPIVPVFWLLMLVILVKGIAEGLLITGGNLLLVWTHGKDVGHSWSVCIFHLVWARSWGHSSLAVWFNFHMDTNGSIGWWVYLA